MLCKGALSTLFDAHHQQLSAEVERLKAAEEKQQQSLSEVKESNQKHVEEVASQCDFVGNCTSSYFLSSLKRVMNWSRDLPQLKQPRMI